MAVALLALRAVPSGFVSVERQDLPSLEAPTPSSIRSTREMRGITGQTADLSGISQSSDKVPLMEISLSTSLSGNPRSARESLFTTLPSLTPAEGPIGTVFQLSEGIAAGSTLTPRLMLDGINVTAQLVTEPGGFSYTSDQAGALIWRVEAQAGSGGPETYSTGASVLADLSSSIDMNGVTFTAPQARVFGLDAAGKAYMVLESGSETLTIARGPTSAGSLAISGVQLNPIRDGSYQQSQGYDARISETYDPLLNQGDSVTVSAGDIVMVAISATPKLGDDGFISDYAALHVVDQLLPAGTILDASTGWTGRGTPVYFNVDMDGFIAGLPTYSATGLSFPSFATLMNSLGKFAAAYAQNTATNSSWGYENLMPDGFSGISGSGYGRDIANMINMACMALISDVYTSAQRRQIAWKLIQHGIEWGEPIRGSGVALSVDGGHHQFHVAPIVLALEATGRRSDISTILGDTGGNFRQAFRVTQNMLDTEFVPHDDLEKPGFARRRTLPPQPGGIALLVPTIYGGTGGVHGDWQQVAIHRGMIATRESDGATAEVVETTNFPATANDDIALPIDAQPTPPFSAGDVITFTAPPGWIDAGSYDWALRAGYAQDGSSGRRSYFSPSADVAYRDLQRWAGQLMLIKALGLQPNQLEDSEGYFLRAVAVAEPSSNNDYPYLFGGFTDLDGTQHFTDSEFFANHWPAISAIPQVLDIDMPVITSITAPGTPTPGTLIDGLVVGLLNGDTSRSVEIRGTGEDSYTVEARIIRASDSTEVVGWAPLGTVSAGAFQGTVTVPKSDGWLNTELRYVGEAEITQNTVNWAVGFKVMLLGQSQMSIFTNADADPAVYSMTPQNHNTVSFWQNQNSGGETVSLLGATDDRDGLSAFVDQFRVFDPNTPLMLVREAIEGTGVLQLVDDTDTMRNWSDLQSKTDRYGGDYTAVISHWDTSNRGGGALGDAAGQYFDIITGVSTHGYTVDHSLADVLEPGYRFIVNPSTRHGYSIGDWRENVVLDANARGFTVGPPITDYPLKDSAHPEGSAPGNAVMGVRMAVSLARDLGLDTSQNPSLAGTASRAESGAYVDVDLTLPNGGVLFSPTPNDLRGWQVSIDGGSSWTYDGFSAEIAGNKVRITPDTGIWPSGIMVGKVGDPYGFTDIATELSIADGELYENWSDDVLGLGLPIHGLITGGDWTMPARAVVAATDTVTLPGTWTPTNLAELSTWHEITDGSEVTLSSGSDVATWIDKSGNGRTLSLNAAAGSVLYQTAGAQGAAALGFIEGGLSYASPLLAIRAAYFVARDMSGGSSGSAFVTPVLGQDFTSGSVVEHIFVRGGDKADYTVSIDGTGATGTTGNASMDGRPMEPTSQTGTNIALSYATINAEAKRNAEAIWAIHLGQSIPVDYVGMMETTSATFLGNGTLSALVLLSDIPSPEDHQRIEGYLAHLTGTQANLPNDHPYKSSSP